MKKLQVEKAGRLNLHKEISLFEEENDIEFPKYYREFLLSQNPYIVKENLYKIAGEEYEIHHFYPFDSEMELSAQKVFEDLNDFFESKYFAFGDDVGGWLFVVSIQKKDYGKIYFCRMDEAIEDGLTILADDFKHFINNLEVSPIN